MAGPTGAQAYHLISVKQELSAGQLHAIEAFNLKGSAMRWCEGQRTTWATVQSYSSNGIKKNFSQVADPSHPQFGKFFLIFLLFFPLEIKRKAIFLSIYSRYDITAHKSIWHITTFYDTYCLILSYKDEILCQAFCKTLSLRITSRSLTNSQSLARWRRWKCEN